MILFAIVYVDAPGTTTPTITISLNKVVATGNRMWNIKVSQIECGQVNT